MKRFSYETYGTRFIIYDRVRIMAWARDRDDAEKIVAALEKALDV